MGSPITKQILFPFNPPLRGLSRGLDLILAYYRMHGVRTVTVRRVILGIGLEDCHYTRTLVGWALNYLAKNGFLERLNNSRPRRYTATTRLLEFLRFHPCLKSCEGCMLFGSSLCPFLQGVCESDET